MVESAKKWKNFIWASWARNGRFGAFFEIKTLGLLGVNLELFHVALFHVLYYFLP
jgi:nucleoside permease NupC